ncbi:MAG: hypothetical protein Q4E22_02185 [Coriobacteriia bacterium]|nr:hypothetical protein [Coriobacteriia bacterium]
MDNKFFQNLFETSAQSLVDYVEDKVFNNKSSFRIKKTPVQKVVDRVQEVPSAVSNFVSERSSDFKDSVVDRGNQVRDAALDGYEEIRSNDSMAKMLLLAGGIAIVTAVTVVAIVKAKEDGDLF